MYVAAPMYKTVMHTISKSSSTFHFSSITSVLIEIHRKWENKGFSSRIQHAVQLNSFFSKVRKLQCPSGKTDSEFCCEDFSLEHQVIYNIIWFWFSSLDKGQRQNIIGNIYSKISLIFDAFQQITSTLPKTVLHNQCVVGILSLKPSSVSILFHIRSAKIDN